MSAWVRRCLNPRCGRTDLRERWQIAEGDVSAHAAWAAPWTCRHCGMHGFALVERDPRAADDRLTER